MRGSGALMAEKLTIRIIPDPVLRQVAVPVKKVDTHVIGIMDGMLEAMYVGKGIGLSANQVGILERIIVVDLSEERDGSKAIFMANPEVAWKSEETFTYNEGCLSIPDQYAEVTRPKRIRVKYLDRSGAAREMEAEDLLSQCIQHEIDHLDGKLFFDYVSPLKRSMMKRKVEKAQRQKKNCDGKIL